MFSRPQVISKFLGSFFINGGSMEKTYTLKEAAATLGVHPIWLGNQYRLGLLRVGKFEVSPCGYTAYVFTGGDIAEIKDSLVLQAEMHRREWHRLYKLAVKEAKEYAATHPGRPGQYHRPASR